MQSTHRHGARRVAFATLISYGGPMKLQRRNWSARNCEALNELLSGVRPGEIAVFDWDNTCIWNDIGEALLRRLTCDLAFRIDAEAMAAMIPDRINGVGQVMLKGKPYSLKKMKHAVFSAYEQLRQGPSSAGSDGSAESYRIFTSGLLALNRALEETPGIGCEFAYPWVNLLLQGLTRPEFDRLATAVIREELRRPIGRRGLVDPLKRWRYDWTAGIRLYPEMKDLAACWQKRGGRVVVSTASNRKLVETMIRMTGFPCQQVIGMELIMAGRHFGRKLKPGLQANLGAGKVANIRSQLGAEPVLAAGDSSNDLEMLTAFSATRVRLVIDRHAPGRIRDLVHKAKNGDKGCLAQGTDRRHGTFAATRGPG
jgi:phosphoserine phosphatase